MPETPGDQNVTKLFGFPGFEAFILVTMKYVNLARQKYLIRRKGGSRG